MTLALNMTLARKHFNIAVNACFSSTGITAVFGASGAGKSSILSAIAGLEKNVQGEITFQQTTWLNTLKKERLTPQQRRAGLVFQDHRLFPHLTVQENLLFAQKRAQKQSLPMADIIQLTGIKKLLTQYPSSLSGGEQQRVAIARALFNQPNILLLDEPFTGLDINHKAALITLLKNINQTYQLPMLYVSHSLDDIQQLADDMVVIENGKLKKSDTTQAVIHWLNYNDCIIPQTSLALPIEPTLSTALSTKGLIALKLDNHQHILLNQPKFDLPETTILHCYIAASDISICLAKPENSSIVNQLAGNISAITELNQQVLIEITCGNENFFAIISLYSAEKLNLTLRQAVFIQFKASSVKILAS